MGERGEAVWFKVWGYNMVRRTDWPKEPDMQDIDELFSEWIISPIEDALDFRRNGAIVSQAQGS